MDNKYFNILGIKPTKDEQIIQEAYHSLLKKYNPEDDAEGFKELRKAYEEALKYSKESDVDTDKAKFDTSSPVGNWMARFDELYYDLYERKDDSNWENLFADEVCTNIDTSLELRDALIQYLLSHTALTKNVWKRINDIFEIEMYEEELCKKYYPQFIKFIIYSGNNAPFVTYNLIEFRDFDEDTSDIDGYVANILRLKDKNDKKDAEGVNLLIESLEGSALYHPFEDVEKMRYYVIQGEMDKAHDIAEKLKDNSDYFTEDGIYIMLQLGILTWNDGNMEEAYEYFKQVLHYTEESYIALTYAAKYQIAHENYHDAKEALMELMAKPEADDELVQMFNFVNQKLEKQYSKELAEAVSEDDKEYITLSLAWCYFQLDNYDKAYKLLHNLKVHKENEYDFENLYGRLLYHMGKYDDALPHLLNRLEKNRKLKEDGTRYARRQIAQRGMSCHMIGCCYYEIGNLEESENYYLEAIKLYTVLSDRLSCMYMLSKNYLQSKQYQKAYDLSNDILKITEQYYLSYEIRQQAAYYLGLYNVVHSDYNEILKYNNKDYKAYSFAIKAFIAQGNVLGAQKVIMAAKETGVSFSLSMYCNQARMLLALNNSEENSRQILGLLDGIIEMSKLTPYNTSKKVSMSDGSETEIINDLENLNEIHGLKILIYGMHKHLFKSDESAAAIDNENSQPSEAENLFEEDKVSENKKRKSYLKKVLNRIGFN